MTNTSMYYIYALYNKKLDKIYIGFTNNLKQRIQDHKNNKVHTTYRMGEIKLIYYEACLSKKDAQTRESQLKTGFGRSYLRRRLKNYFEGARSSVG